MGQHYVFGKQRKLYFQLPETLRVLNNVVLSPSKPSGPLIKMIEGALTKPIGKPPLADQVKASDKIAIIVDDFTRPTPKAAILNGLVDHLRELGVDYDQIDIVFGLGTHRPVTDDEVREALGPALFGKVRVTNHDSRAEDLTSVGTSSLYGELKVNPLVAAADFRIAVGSVLPHPMAGFGGGAKLVMPGVSNFEFIRHHHMSTFLPRLNYGETEGNSNRDGICEAAHMARLDFIVNAVYNAEHEVMALVAGDFEKAHQVGVQMSLKEYGVKIEPKSDVTIISAFPYDEGNQIIKPLIPGTMVTKKGGTVILVASAIHGGRLPEPILKAFDKVWDHVDSDPLMTAVKFIKEGKLIIPDGPLDFNAGAYLSLLILSRVRVILVTHDATMEQAARLGFDYAQNIDQAIGKVAAEIPHGKVNVIPSGGTIVPLVNQPLSFV